jgi:hypothetical protein
MAAKWVKEHEVLIINHVVVDRPGYLNSISASIGGTYSSVRLPSIKAAAG